MGRRYKPSSRLFHGYENHWIERLEWLCRHVYNLDNTTRRRWWSINYGLIQIKKFSLFLVLLMFGKQILFFLFVLSMYSEIRQLCLSILVNMIQYMKLFLSAESKISVSKPLLNNKCMINLWWAPIKNILMCLIKEK